MTDLPELVLIEPDLDAIAQFEGRIAVFLGPDGKLDRLARRVNRVTKGALARFAASEAGGKLKEGEAATLAWPSGLAAEELLVVRLDPRSRGAAARKAGAGIGKGARGTDTLILAGSLRGAAEIAEGALLRAYAFDVHRTGDDADRRREKGAGKISLAIAKPSEIDGGAISALAEGVAFARDLTNEPANVLTTVEFANRLKALEADGVTVEVLEEDTLEKLGMGALLGVGQGSDTPSKVVVMEWKGGGDEGALALVGKGVVFDTGGISLKPREGMEDMTADMGGAGVVAGVMTALARRKAAVNVVGVVGLVENMPDGRAQRPGDVVRSMKGDTIEVINTDAEGRLVLADLLWYVQERFAPTAIVDLATLTGAVVIALGHENAGVFSNDDDFADALLGAAKAEDEGAWRMPMGPGYDKALKSRVADMRNSFGRPGASITAAQFLKRFVKDDQPWVHLDIAGVASLPTESDLAPKGATGWGVRTLVRLVEGR